MPGKGEKARAAILDAALACIVEYGWDGANMSVICRRAKITRGRLQYYFPTMDDLARASIDHLNTQWRIRYFASMDHIVETTDRFDAEVEAVWRLVRDPLHIAKQALEATARTNSELDALMQQSVHAHEEASLDAVRGVYPALASLGERPLTLSRNFVMVFMEGLSLYRFDGDAEAERRALINMLKRMLIDFWNGQGATDLANDAVAATPPTPNLPSDRTRERRALALIREAVDLLEED